MLTDHAMKLQLTLYFVFFHTTQSCILCYDGLKWLKGVHLRRNWKRWRQVCRSDIKLKLQKKVSRWKKKKTYCTVHTTYLFLFTLQSTEIFSLCIKLIWHNYEQAQSHLHTMSPLTIRKSLLTKYYRYERAKVKCWSENEENKVERGEEKGGDFQRKSTWIYSIK